MSFKKNLGIALWFVVVFSMLLTACGATPEAEVVEVEVTKIVQETVIEPT